MAKRIFPEDFLWGASVASHQVEGGTHNQWSEWEVANANRLAETAQKRLSWLPNWQGVKSKAQSPENYISGKGTEHYSRYAEDFGLVKELNMNAFRFGVEWSRLEPTEGQWDEKEVEHYRQYIDAMKRLGIEPVLTLWHWTMPIWFTEKGGFEKRRNLKYFERFVVKVIKEYGDQLKYVLILNEPNVYVIFSYLQGAWPPQRKNPLRTLQVYYNLALVHRSTYRSIKSIKPSLVVGIAAQLSDIEPVNGSAFNKLSVKISDYIFNWWFLNRIKNDLDFIGLNYYFTQYINGLGIMKNPPQPLNDLGWYMEPKGIEPLLEKIWERYKKPLLITENGVADERDEYRQWWLEQTILALQNAQSHGVRLLGYLHWSLLDNFEWAYGWWPKFGLVAVDRQTMRRTIRPSGRWFAKQIK